MVREGLPLAGTNPEIVTYWVVSLSSKEVYEGASESSNRERIHFEFREQIAFEPLTERVTAGEA